MSQNNAKAASDGATILCVDDDPAVGKVLSALLVQAGMRALCAANATEALELLGRRAVDLVVSDLRMPGIGGMDLLRSVVERHPDVPVVILTAHGTVALAVEAMRAGAADFLLKPFDRDEVLYVVEKTLRAQAPSAPAAAFGGALGVLGVSPAMRELDALVRRAAQGSATVLVRGETGTGKELVARAIHERSARATAPFVKLNCAALPDALLESELFGHEKGAFTGAANRKPGRVELASGGTLFLDEIGDVPPATQVKLLRVLQEREIERVGGTETIKVDVRFVAATHQNLEGLVARGDFREDLFYRLNVVPLEVPPLRERREDIPALVAHFAKSTSSANGRGEAAFAPDAVELLAAQPWPGNVRQLENMIERLVVLSDTPAITRVAVERELEREAARARTARGSSGDAPSALGAQRREAEREAVLDALARSGNNRSLAARLLGVSRRTLYKKLEDLGVT
ncbi:MAG TPA: sigma-54 dependent transcriptional regulator [Polyangiaceae bacterium]